MCENLFNQQPNNSINNSRQEPFTEIGEKIKT